jgi:hypothetical protein
MTTNLQFINYLKRSVSRWFRIHGSERIGAIQYIVHNDREFKVLFQFIANPQIKHCVGFIDIGAIVQNAGGKSGGIVIIIEKFIDIIHGAIVTDTSANRNSEEGKLNIQFPYMLDSVFQNGGS